MISPWPPHLRENGSDHKVALFCQGKVLQAITPHLGSGTVYRTMNQAVNTNYEHLKEEGILACSPTVSDSMAFIIAATAVSFKEARVCKSCSLEKRQFLNCVLPS